jgi:hypothetical protein
MDLRHWAGDYLMATEDDVRDIALALPEVTEDQWYGTPGYKVAGKGFLRLRTEAEGGLVVFVPDLGEKEALLAANPEAYYTTPHYDGYPAILVNLAAADLDELRELITESWRIKAPLKLRDSFPRGTTPLDPRNGTSFDAGSPGQ